MKSQDCNRSLSIENASCKVSWHYRISTGLIGLLAIGLTSYRAPCASAVTQGLSLCFQTLLPALFPFFVLSGLVVETGLVQQIGAKFSFLMSRYFHLPGSSTSLFLLGALGGYPTGARAVSQFYQQGLCSKHDAQRMLGFCNNCGPGFFLGIVGGTLLGNTAAGMVLWIIHLISAVIVTLLFRHKDKPLSNQNLAFTPLPFPQALVKSVTGAVQSTLGVCGFVLFFSVLLRMLQESGILSLFSALFNVFGMDYTFGSAFSAGLLEISCGITALCDSTASLPVKGAAAAFLLSFGGCSVFFQTMQQTESTELSLRIALRHKLLQSMLAAAMSYLYLLFAFRSTSAFLSVIPPVSEIQTGAFYICCLLFSLFALAKGRKSRYNKKEL